MSESYAGITVPEGEPDGLRAAAARFAGACSSLQAAGAELASMPGSAGPWQGPASVSYAGSCHAQADAARAAGGSARTAAETARTYATALEAAQREARQAIDEARDAQARIDAA